MKWLGEYVNEFVTRFRSDIYLENGADIYITDATDSGDYFKIETTTHGATTLTTIDDDATAAHFEIAADGDIILDSAGQIKLEPVAGNSILLDGTVTVDGGTVTGVTRFGLDSVSITAVQTSAESFADDDTSIMTSAAINDRFSLIAGSSSITTLGTITTGTWSGTAIETNRLKHLMHYFFKGYGTGDNTNYEIPVLLTDNQAPWEHNTSAGSDGLTAITVQTQMRMGGTAMPQACTLKKWTGWTTCSGTSGTAYIGLFKLTPVANDNSDVSLVLLDAISYTPLGNAKSVAIELIDSDSILPVNYISMSNIHSTDSANVDLYLSDSDNSYYIFKSIAIPVGISLVLKDEEIGFDRTFYSLYIKLGASGSTVDVIIKD